MKRKESTESLERSESKQQAGLAVSRVVLFVNPAVDLRFPT